MARFGELNGVKGWRIKLLNELMSHGDRGVGPPKPLPGQPKGDPLGWAEIAGESARNIDRAGEGPAARA